MRVLIVEDDDAIRYLLDRLLQRHGVTVVCVPGALEAVAALRDEPVDLLLLDLMMPIHNGFHVIDFLRTNRDRARTVIVISAADDDLLRRVDPAVVHGFLKKPFDFPQLIKLVADCSPTPLTPVDLPGDEAEPNENGAARRASKQQH